MVLVFITPMPHHILQPQLVRGTARRGGARGVGGLGEALGGWGIRGISSIYYTICTYTHAHTYDYCKETPRKFEKSVSCRQKSIMSWAAVDQIGPGPKYYYFSSDYGNPIFNRTVPYALPWKQPNKIILPYIPSQADLCVVNDSHSSCKPIPPRFAPSLMWPRLWTVFFMLRSRHAVAMNHDFSEDSSQQNTPTGKSRKGKYTVYSNCTAWYTCNAVYPGSISLASAIRTLSWHWKLQ